MRIGIEVTAYYVAEFGVPIEFICLQHVVDKPVF